VSCYGLGSGGTSGLGVFGGSCTFSSTLSTFGASLTTFGGSRQLELAAGGLVTLPPSVALGQGFSTTALDATGGALVTAEAAGTPLGSAAALA
jgi:hypothetical protein